MERVSRRSSDGSINSNGRDGKQKSILPQMIPSPPSVLVRAATGLNASIRAPQQHSMVKALQSHGVNPALSKELARSINAVSRNVKLAVSSFDTVRRIISDPSLKLESCLQVPNKVDNQLVKLQGEWSQIQVDFMEILKMSSKVAMSAATMIEDFVRNIMPFLLDDSDIRAKQAELKVYRLSIEKGGDVAFTFVGNLKDICRRVGDFKYLWSDHTKGAYLSLESQVKDLESTIREIETSTTKAKRILKELKTSQAVKPPPQSRVRSGPSRPPSQKDLKEEIKNKTQDMKEATDKIKESERATEKHLESEKQVSHHTDSIAARTDDLASIWNLIFDDINCIESHIEIMENGESERPQLFKQRLMDLNAQYCDFRDVLRIYSYATTGTPRPKKKLFGFIGF
ncbi:hypothetical protein SCHPADRAFT_940391 [Schizopora paradoxa]|uniref:Uncharacterized protein n=1 Tax=Schizopora paradoxa TaxID=27342 RepID=A0A0H2RPI4_9AGAM|nr:hypothetical protein SCHPADRAFT_940391 [Schizopora paradoxa]